MPRRKVWRARIFSARGKPKLNGRCTFTSSIYILIRPYLLTRLFARSYSLCFSLASSVTSLFRHLYAWHFYTALEKTRTRASELSRRKILFFFLSISTRISSSSSSGCPQRLFHRIIFLPWHKSKFLFSRRENIVVAQDFCGKYYRLIKQSSISRTEVRSIRANVKWRWRAVPSGDTSRSFRLHD